MAQLHLYSRRLNQCLCLVIHLAYFPATRPTLHPTRFAGTIMQQYEIIFLLCCIINVNALTISRTVVTSTASSPFSSALTQYALSKQRWRKFFEMMTLLRGEVEGLWHLTNAG
jgi:hypothetical protein